MAQFDGRRRASVRLGKVMAPGLRFECQKCSHHGLIAIAEARRLWGQRTTLAKIAGDIVCAQCKRKSLQISIEVDARKFSKKAWGSKHVSELDGLVATIRKLDVKKVS